MCYTLFSYNLCRRAEVRKVSFSEAMSRKYPEWVVLVSTKDKEGKPNVMPAGWAMIVSGNPPMFAVAIGHGRYTHEIVEDQKEFVIAFPAPGMEQIISYCGSHSGRDVDKFVETDLEAIKADELGAPLIAGCPINLECMLKGELETGDHTVFAGEVVASHIEEDVSEHLLNFSGKFALAKPIE